MGTIKKVEGHVSTCDVCGQRGVDSVDISIQDAENQDTVRVCRECINRALLKLEK